MNFNFEITGTFRGHIELPAESIEEATELFEKKIDSNELIIHTSDSSIESFILSEK